MKSDRIRFEENARQYGVKVLISTSTQLQILATDNRMITTYHFNDNSKFKSIDTEYVDSRAF